MNKDLRSTIGSATPAVAEYGCSVPDRASPTRRTRPGGRLALSVVAAAAAMAAAVVLPGTAAASPATAPPVGLAPSAISGPPAGRQLAERPGNGEVLTRHGAGRGVFVIDNTAGPDDAVVTLGREARASVVVYVRSGAQATVGRIPNGVFDVYAERGRNWNTSVGRFDLPASSGRFDRRASFTTERAADGVHYSELTVTLYAVPDGNTALVAAPESAIPS